MGTMNLILLRTWHDFFVLKAGLTEIQHKLKLYAFFPSPDVVLGLTLDGLG